jgi:hypothetical protein
MNKTKSYNGDYMDIGKQGEQKVIEWLKARPSVLGISDFRDIRVIHEADIDIGIRLYKGNICLAEIKTDTYLGTTGNVLNEILRINHYANHQYAGYLGWTLRSPAEWLFYYAPNRKIPAIYIGRFSDIRLVLQRWTKNTEHSVVITRTDEIKTTYNILIPECEYDSVFSINEI